MTPLWVLETLRIYFVLCLKDHCGNFIRVLLAVGDFEDTSFRMYSLIWYNKPTLIMKSMIYTISHTLDTMICKHVVAFFSVTGSTELKYVWCSLAGSWMRRGFISQLERLASWQSYRCLSVNLSSPLSFLFHSLMLRNLVGKGPVYTISHSVVVWPGSQLTGLRQLKSYTKANFDLFELLIPGW